MRKIILFISLLIAGNLAAKTVSEREAVAACLVLEAGGDGRRGLSGVAHVIENRSKAQNKSFYQVILARNQFATMKNGAAFAINKAKTRRFAAALPEALKIVDDMRAGRLGADFTKGSLYFESFKRNPKFFRKLTPTIRIGANAFYR